MSLARECPLREAPVAETGCDDVWKRLTLQANQAKAASDAESARSLYRAALAEAERVFGAAASGALPAARALAPMLYNISCHNLAQHLLDEGEEQVAIDLFERAFERLEAAILAPLELDWRISCARHLQVSTAALAEVLIGRGARERVENYVARANAAISALSEIVQTHTS